MKHVPDCSFPESCGLPGRRDSIGPWVFRSSALNAAECLKLSFAALAVDQVVFQDCIQLPCCPLEAALGVYAQLLPVVIADPSCQFQRQPAENWVGFAKQILKPLWRRLHIICTHYIRLPWRDIMIRTGRLEEMHVKALLTRKVMVCNAVSRTSLSFSALHLHFMCDINDIMNVFMISYMIYIWIIRLRLDALFVQLPRVYRLQCWVLDPQFTSNSFTLVVNSRGRDRFLSTLTLIMILCSVSQNNGDGNSVRSYSDLGQLKAH